MAGWLAGGARADEAVCGNGCCCEHSAKVVRFSVVAGVGTEIPITDCAGGSDGGGVAGADLDEDAAVAAAGLDGGVAASEKYIIMHPKALGLPRVQSTTCPTCTGFVCDLFWFVSSFFCLLLDAIYKGHLSCRLSSFFFRHRTLF